MKSVRRSRVIRQILQINGRNARKETMCVEGLCKGAGKRKYTVKLIETSSECSRNKKQVNNLILEMFQASEEVNSPEYAQ